MQAATGDLTDELQVFPKPRHVGLGGSGARSTIQPTFVPDPSLNAQGYELRIINGAVEIRHSDDAGARYGDHTLSQLRDRFPDEIPGLTIRDWPDTLIRAYMLDVSRNRVPTMETLEWLIGVLASCRVNQLQLYTEHTFAYADHETVWRDASPITAAEMARLDNLCNQNGIELVPCLNVFGHMGPWLLHDEYRDRAECPGGFDVPIFGTHLDPLTLEPTEANAEFALGLIRELCDTVTTKRVNICCDEALELGRGRSEAQVAVRGKGHVFVDHLLRIVEPLIEEGHDVLFWGDMFRIDPDPISRLPLDCATAVAWQYDPPSDPGAGISFLAAIPEVAELLGLPADIHLGFESQTRQLADAEYPFWVAPGTGSWNSLIGRWPHAKANLIDAVDVGLAAGATGFLITDWGDTGHMQPLSISSLPIAYGAALAWCSDENRDPPAPSEVDRVVFANPDAGLAEPLAAIGGLAGRCGRTAINGSALFYDLLTDPPIPAFGSSSDADLEAVVDALDTATSEIVNSAPRCDQATEIQVELEAAIRLARHGAWRIGRIGGDTGKDDGALHDDLAEAIEIQKAAWLGRSRQGELDLSVGLLEKTLSTYQH